jgi:hypothetical protein
MPLVRVFHAAAVALPAFIRKLVGARRAALRSLHMLFLACHHIRVILVACLIGIEPCNFRYQKMLAWPDLQV